MSANTRLYGVTLDCAEPQTLATFYSEPTGMKVAHTSEDFAGLEGDTGLAMGFQRVEKYQAPQWPGQQVPQQFHLDIAVDNLDESEAKVIGLGAVKAGNQPGGDRWRVFLDPAGHPFCLARM